MRTGDTGVTHGFEEAGRPLLGLSLRVVFHQATRLTRTTTTACTACPWAAPGRERRRPGASAVATLLRPAMLTLRSCPLHPTGWSTADSSVPRGVAVPRDNPWERRQQQGVRVQRRGRLHLLQLLLLHPHWGRAHSYPYKGCQ